ncbi:reverse transcriptase [Trichonephila clavipes]|nr:reverse transcriptase [Trichonephila clavipes]
MTLSLSHVQGYHVEEYGFLSQIVTGYETWGHHFEPEGKRQSKQWKRATSSPPKKSKAVHTGSGCCRIRRKIQRGDSRQHGDYKSTQNMESQSMFLVRVILNNSYEGCDLKWKEKGLGKPWKTLATAGPIPRHLEKVEGVSRFRLSTGYEFLGVYHWLSLAAEEACPLCDHARIDGDHLLQCTGLDEYPTDDVVSRDEAHFWLNGYVNKQNCRIWSKANPQVYVETPLYPEKLTVWCALWAGGILLQKR